MSAESPKVGRTIRLTPEINQRLLDLCAHFGTTPNAYLVSEIGKAISRDEIHFRAVNQSLDQAQAFLDRLQNEGSTSIE